MMTASGEGLMMTKVQHWQLRKISSDQPSSQNSVLCTSLMIAKQRKANRG